MLRGRSGGGDGSTTANGTTFGTYLTVPARSQLRRCSSLQLPLHTNKVAMAAETSYDSARLYASYELANAAATMPKDDNNYSSSTLSICASSLSIAVIGHAESAINLYTMMARYRLVLLWYVPFEDRIARGRLHVRIAISYCVNLVLALYWYYKATLSEEQQRLLSVPIIVVALYQVIASASLLTGLLTEWHWLLIPFHISCIVCMMSAMGIGMILLVSADRALTQLYPVFAALSMALVAVYLWFLVISCMSFVLLRDKKRVLTCDLAFVENHANAGTLERVNSSHF
ncbi:unnamed protein product [Anisakis simplex]|uniref:Uncharacterized protein n=1 Tax=Anisakis simplex TaxID=6269 RepID=A0A0M3JV26_ANISI|nr:unnamed protein product [Anisakis simplex]